MAQFIDRLRNASRTNKIIAGGTGIGVAIVGYTLAITAAAGPFASVETEVATTSGQASIISDSLASGGKAIKFGASTSNGGGTTVSGGWPSAPNVICGNTTILNGPSTAPAGAITVAAGDNSNVSFSTAGKTYWFAPGVHTLGSGQYAQIAPGANTTYIGAPGAIIDGQNKNETAFGGTNTGITIKYLTIRNFNTPHDQGTVNHESAAGWTVSNNTMTNSKAAAIFAGTNNVVSYNCLTKNGQYGFQTYNNNVGPTHIVLDHNEISYNNTGDTEHTAGIANCGCSGGGKFWDSHDVTVTNNYVHDNLGIGLWADTVNSGFLIQNNWIENNENSGIMYEVSYNFAIRNNVFKHNAVSTGPTNPGFPTGAIYISESGSDSRVTTAGNNFNAVSDISNNLFQDNWSGVIMWENSNRFCSQGLPTTQCTLVNPSTFTVSSCATNLKTAKQGSTPDYFNDCRWQTKNISVKGNTFSLNPANVAGCTYQKACGFNAIFSNYSSSAPYKAADIPINITFNQNNHFSNNTYKGPWYFEPWAQSNTHFPVTFAEWQKPVTDKCSTASEVSGGTCNSGFGQDAGSTYTP